MIEQLNEKWNIALRTQGGAKPMTKDDEHRLRAKVKAASPPQEREAAISHLAKHYATQARIHSGQAKMSALLEIAYLLSDAPDSNVLWQQIDELCRHAEGEMQEFITIAFLELLPEKPRTGPHLRRLWELGRHPGNEWVISEAYRTVGQAIHERDIARFG